MARKAVSIEDAGAHALLALNCLDRAHDYEPSEPYGVELTKTARRLLFSVVDAMRAAGVLKVSDDLAAVAACESECREVLHSSVSAARSQPYYLDVTHPEATKGGVVAYLSHLFQIPHEQIATLGDMPNDILMFEKSGLSIAMGNASAEVQSRASFVTASYEDEGFAKAIDQFILTTAPRTLDSPSN